MADMHFDAVFKLLSTKSNLGQIRRMDQRVIFNNIIDIIKKEQIKYFFISGDLYEQKYAKESTIDFINSKFKEIPNTRIFITPGNHDPYIKNSFYNNYNWAENVKIFGKEVEKIETEEANIYGFGFTDYNSTIDLNHVNLTHEKPNILVMHASLDGQDQYNPITTVELRAKGFDYIALGHIHKTNFKENNNMIYPGSPLSQGFDELGEHGIIKGEITDQVKLEFIKTDNKIFIEKEIDTSQMGSTEDLIEEINKMQIEENEIYKITLVGTKTFDIQSNILELLNKNIIKIKDKTSIGYDLEAIAKEESLKGIFVRNLLKKLPENPEEVKKAIAIGLEIFD